MATRIWTGAAGDNDLDNPANWRPGPEITGPLEPVYQGEDGKFYPECDWEGRYIARESPGILFIEDGTPRR